MNRTLPIALSLIAPLLLAPAVQAAEPPISSYSAQFEAEVAGFKMGEIERSLRKHQDGVYEQTSLIYSTGLLSVFRPDRFEEHSYWRWQHNSPVPERYTYHFSGNKGDVYEELVFDWEKMQVNSTRDGKTTTLPIEKGVVDKLSYQVALVNDLRAGKKEFFYKVADRGDIRHIRYKLVGEEDIDTPWGEQHALKVKRVTLTNERITTLWFAPDLDYMVIKIVQDDNGTKMSGRITDLSIEGMNLVKVPGASDDEFIWPSD
jgi:hypothetical protein